MGQKGYRRVIALGLAERGWIPDTIVRYGIRQLLQGRLGEQRKRFQTVQGAKPGFYERLRKEPIAVQTADANRQHYEMPAEMFKYILGPRLKYSCALYPSGAESLNQAEDAMLELTCRRADIRDGMSILELGCGWGSLSLWIAEHFPNARIVAVSNSASQRAFIEQEAKRRGLQQLTVLTQNLTEFSTQDKFDRVVSIEMFEHMRNYHLLLSRIAQWLNPAGKLFVHIFCHRQFAYLFETNKDADWMAKHFFTGGIMPSQDIFSYFNDHLHVCAQWEVNGHHYAQTCEAWLTNQDQNRKQILKVLRNYLPDNLAALQYRRWRIFFMACAELFRFAHGQEWKVGHYLLKKIH